MRFVTVNINKYCAKMLNIRRQVIAVIITEKSSRRRMYDPTTTPCTLAKSILVSQDQYFRLHNNINLQKDSNVFFRVHVLKKRFRLKRNEFVKDMTPSNNASKLSISSLASKLTYRHKWNSFCFILCESGCNI